MMRLSVIAAAAAAATFSQAELLAKCASQSCSGSGGDCPTDNPVTALFGDEFYSWTALIAWSNVYSVADYTGNLQGKIDAAATAAAACSPATINVVYVPPGSYTADGSILLPSNIIFRGSSPSTAVAKIGKLPGDLAPSSKLTFPQLQLSSLGCAANATQQCSGVGVVHLDIDGAGINIAANASSPLALVFGNRIQNVNFMYPGGPGTTWPFAWPYRFSRAIGVSQSPNLLIGNNLVNKSSLALKTTVSFAGRGKSPGYNGTLVFPVDNRYGINAGQPQGSYTVNASVDSNYVYQNGRVGIVWESSPQDLSKPGQGMRVVNNHVEVAANTTCWTITGVDVASGSDTNENRGYDQTGIGGSYVVNNTAHVHRQIVAYGPYMTVDGEGVLQQPQDGLTAVSNVWMNNDLTGGTSGYMAYYNLKNITGNVVTGNSVISTEFIGIADCHGCVSSENVCQDNNMPCQGM